MRKIRLGVNIDHVATIRNARGGNHPDPVKAAILAQEYGADGITIHLREDRRHIRDEDLKAIRGAIDMPLNLEMAATEEMLEIALGAKPNAACIVPEKRQEVTTEGGLDVIGGEKVLAPIIARLKYSRIRVSLFVDANEDQIRCCAKLGTDIIEIHTGEFCRLFDEEVLDKSNGIDYSEEILRGALSAAPSVLEGGKLDLGAKSQLEFDKIVKCAQLAEDLGLECHAGHGLNYETATIVAKIPQIVELNIGHFLIGEAIFDGFEVVIKKMKEVIER